MTSEDSGSCIIPKDVLEDSLKKYYNDKTLSVKTIRVTAPPLKGEHFASIVEHVDVTVTSRSNERELALFMKRAVQNEYHEQMLSATKIHEKEDRFFNVLLIDYRELSKTSRPPMSLEFIPRPIYVKDDVVLLENIIKTHGFKMHPFDLKGQNLTSVKLTLSTLAKFHSLSFVMKQEGPLKEKYDFLENLMFCDAMAPAMGAFLNSTFAAIASILKDVPKYSTIVENFTRLSQYLFKIGQECTIPEEPLNVICHGDCWNNNMLFHYKDAESEIPDDIRLVDYQILRYIPLTCDLLYFINSSTSVGFRNKYLDEVLRYYYGQFYNALVGFGIESKCFPYEALVADYKKRRLLGLVFSVPMLMVCVIPKEEMPDAEDMTEDGPAALANMMIKLGENEQVREVVGNYLSGLYNEIEEDILKYLEKKEADTSNIVTTNGDGDTANSGAINGEIDK